jgi:hypothetical protein
LKLPYIQEELAAGPWIGGEIRRGKAKQAKRARVPAGVSGELDHGNGAAKVVAPAKPR